MIQLCGKNDGSVPSAAPLSSAGFTMTVPRLRHRFQVGVIDKIFLLILINKIEVVYVQHW